MSFESLPPIPEFTPPSAGGNLDGLSQVQTSNIAPSTERDRIARSVARGAKIKAAAASVIQNRSQLVSYLRQNGLDLWTSAVEFQKTSDFIVSSYVIYPKHGNFKEPFVNFLQRYPNLLPAAQAIRDSLRPVSSQMQVVTPRNF